MKDRKGIIMKERREKGGRGRERGRARLGREERRGKG